MKENLVIYSKCDGLKLGVTIFEPKGKCKGIIQISHGMSEHKERYYEFMQFLANNGYVSVIHDHRGHGESVKDKNDLGYFYTKNIDFIVSDLYQVTELIKDKYKDIEVIIFSHSMGTLVSRNYLKKYDSKIKKIILCGPPTKNILTPLAIFLAKISILFGNEKKRAKLLNKLTFGSYNKKYNLENEWVCSNKEEVIKYNNDDLCGFIFTKKGFLNLYQLMKGAFDSKNWLVKNPKLDIFVIAGSDDPVIQSETKISELINFLNKIGYKNVKSKIYKEKRHELLNEIEKEKIYEDVLSFIEE